MRKNKKDPATARPDITHQVSGLPVKGVLCEVLGGGVPLGL